jgi:hypothetical protein
MTHPNPLENIPYRRLGRPPGSKNKAQNDIRQYARQYSVEAIERFVTVMRTGKDGDAVYAADKLLDRAFGKAAQAQTGENGEGPINHRVLVEFVRAQPMKEIDHE